MSLRNNFSKLNILSKKQTIAKKPYHSLEKVDKLYTSSKHLEKTFFQTNDLINFVIIDITNITDITIFISIIQIAVTIIIYWHYHYYCCQHHLKIMIIIAIIIIIIVTIIIVIIIIIIIIIIIAFSYDYCYDYYCYFSESRPIVFLLLMAFTINIPFIVFKFTLQSSLNIIFVWCHKLLRDNTEMKIFTFCMFSFPYISHICHSCITIFINLSIPFLHIIMAKYNLPA